MFTPKDFNVLSLCNKMVNIWSYFMVSRCYQMLLGPKASQIMFSNIHYTYLFRVNITKIQLATELPRHFCVETKRYLMMV